MTAQLAAVPGLNAVSGDELAVLRGMLRPDFLARAGWDPVAQVLTPVRGDPLLSLKECAVAGCAASTAHRQADLCVTCRTRWTASELAWEDFLARPGGGRPRGDRPCRVTGCPRPGESDERLCATHTAQRQRHPGLPAESWLARPEVGPLPSFGACIVASCAATAANRSGMCSAHSIAWCRHRRDHGGAVLAEWARHAAPADVAGHEVVLRGLPERVIAELLAGLQRRTDAGLRTLPTSTRCLVRLLHARQAGSVLDLAQVPGAEIRPDARQLLRWLAAELYCLLSGPEKERAKDVWQLRVFGLPGKLDFTGISQRSLFNDLCKARGWCCWCDWSCASRKDLLSVIKDEFEGVQAAVAEGVAREGLQDLVLSAEESAAKRLADAVSDEAVDQMIADAKDAGISLLDGPDGLIGQLTARLIERALGAEMDDHLGYVKGDPAGNGSGNSRNGSYGKTVTTTAGPVRISVPRDRNAEFEPRIVAKGQRRVGQVDEMILSLYARGMTTRDIQAHLEEIYGVNVSPALISNVTDVVQDEIIMWQTRPLDSFYAILYIDALVVKVRDGGAVENKAAYLVTGVDADGFKHVLGIWLGGGEGSGFWAGVLAELRNRGIRDVLFVCCDGLKGLPEAIKATWKDATVQTCVIHLIRSSMKYVSWKDRKKAAALMRPIYTAVNEAAAKAALENLRREYGKKSPGLVAAWDRAWDQFVPFLKFDKSIRRVVYTTNAIESINFQLRKITKNRGHFPNDDAAIKLLYLGIRNITGRHIDGDGLVLERGERGTGTLGWKAALNALSVAFPDRVPV